MTERWNVQKKSATTGMWTGYFLWDEDSDEYMSRAIYEIAKKRFPDTAFRLVKITNDMQIVDSTK